MLKTATLALFLFIVNFSDALPSTTDCLLIQLKSGKDINQLYSALLLSFDTTYQSEANNGKYVDLLGYYHRHYCQVDSTFYHYQIAHDAYRKLEGKTALAAVHISLEDMNNNNGRFLEAFNAERDIYERFEIKHGISTYVTHLVNQWQHERRLLKWCSFDFFI